MTDAQPPEFKIETRAARPWVKPAAIAASIIIIALLPLFLGDSYMIHVLILTFTYIVTGVSFRTISISGQFSIAHAAFMGIGAYVAGMA
jgi:branched-chain amino acid transport system permease protein